MELELIGGFFNFEIKPKIWPQWKDLWDIMAISSRIVLKIGLPFLKVITSVFLQL